MSIWTSADEDSLRDTRNEQVEMGIGLYRFKNFVLPALNCVEKVQIAALHVGTNYR